MGGEQQATELELKIRVSVEQGVGPGVRSSQEESVTPQRKVRKQGRYMRVRAKTGLSTRVRWLNYCCIIPHVFDKLPQKGKNKQSCTV